MPDLAPLLVLGHPTPRMQERLGSRFELHMLADQETPEIWLAENGARFVYAMLVGHARVDTALLELLPNLKLLSNYGVGYDTIDAESCAARGILVTHTPDVLNSEVANTAILLMLACYRALLRDEAYARSGQWAVQGAAPLTRSVDGAKVGILGMGRIGQELARRLSIFDVEIVYHGRSDKGLRYRFCPDLVQMAYEVDCLFVITPGGADTRHLVNRPVIEALGPRGTLINVARGTVVDEDALADCLTTGALGWAGLDVFEAEPEIHPGLRASPNTVLLPHVGSATEQTRQAMGDLVVDNLLDHLTKGTVRTPVPECQGLTG